MTSYSFPVEDCDIKKANEIRKQIQNIETLAVGKVHIIRNDGIMTNDVLAHRIGMIIVERPAKKLKGKDLEAILDVTGPAVVTSFDIQSSKVKIPFELQLAPLKANERLYCKLYFEYGRKEQHAKWESAIGVSFEPQADGSCKFKYESNGSLTQDDFLDELEKIIE